MAVQNSTGFVVAGGFGPSAIMDQIGGWGVVGILVAVVVAVVILKIIFSILKKVVAVIVTLALTGALGGGILGLANGWFGQVSEVFQGIFDAMPWR